MTRGRTANTAHLVAADLAEAREQWIAVFGRDRADLGPGHAAELAAERPPATASTARSTGRQPLPRGRPRRYRASPGPRPSGGDRPSPVGAPRPGIGR